MKAQFIRLLDVVYTGPLLLAIAANKSVPKHVRSSLFVIGISTIVYNGVNFLLEDKKAVVE